MTDYAMVATAEAASDNVGRYRSQLADFPALADRLGYHQSWYAVRDGGKWHFGPSKFIGYENIDAKEYLKTAKQRNGRATESHLRKWFAPVPDNTDLFSRLATELSRFLARHGGTARSTIRINVLKEELAQRASNGKVPAAEKLLADLLIAVARNLPMEERRRVKAALRYS
jgi:hypothetical protein